MTMREWDFLGLALAFVAIAFIIYLWSGGFW
jgi:hypothetical protein